MSEGTPLDALETGEVEATADADRMSAILQDINASGAEVVQAAPRSAPQQPPMGGMMQPMGPMPSMHPMYMQQPPPQNHYVPVDEPPRPRKKNMWSSALDGLRDPLIVSVLFFVLSLPVLHTFAAKYAHWAFAVGGQLSWLGLIAFSALSGVIFGLLQGVGNMMS